MRICLLSYRSYRYSGGQGIYLHYLSQSLRDLGHRVDVISGPPYPELDDGVRLIKLPSLDLYSMSSVRRLFINPKKLNTYASLVEWAGTMSGYFSEPLAFGMRAYELMSKSGNNKYDVIHDNQTMAYGILKIKEMGLPVVETIHHPVTIDRDLAVQSATSLKNKLGLRRWFSFINMQMKVARKLAHIITVSQTARQHIADEFRIPEDKLRVVYNGIDTDIFSPSPKIVRLDNRLLVVISRDTPVKGLRFMLEALAVLRQKHDLELIVVAKGTDNQTTQRLIYTLGIEDYVKIIDEIDTEELVRQYRLATIVVIPSVYEGFGLPAAEAMACQAPVVSTTAGALPEVVGDAGVLVPPADVKALVDAISALVVSPDKRKHLSVTGRRRIVRTFNWRNTAKQTIDVYAEAIDDQKYMNSST
ncbi:MAG: glycosyltransferase family 4 protein [Dehalococcoidia bacterium]|nr:glycosyltransferase family 4 protein [Dehalococcoidia bacterium]